ncbi:nodulin MtN21 /EamA-like transporter family protein [Euphorbia peplus]|nr:nodulin MtN21 /EamA-like transporter family protein [Euphorbia peplus]
MWVSGVTIAMVAVEFTEMSLTTLMKAAMAKGMTPFIYILYSNALAIFILVPSSFFFYRERARPKLTLAIISKIFLLAILSLCIQAFINTGIKYSSPTLSSAILDLTPAFTFLLAIISRMEKVEMRLASSQAKAMGTIISVGGALIVTLYKGQPITIDINNNITGSHLLMSLTSNWVVGGFLCSAGAFCLALLFIVQAWLLKDYPAELMITTITCTFVTLLSAILTLIVEKDSSVWVLKPDVELIAIVCSAIFAVSFRSLVHTWAVRKKGPLYTSMFKPLGMVITTFLGVSFLGDNLHIGSVIGGITIAFGFYTVIWGKAQEKKMFEVEDKGISNFETSSPRLPLLQNKSVNV